MAPQLTDFLRMFAQNVQYTIPVWQRAYSWDKHTILELISDLEAIAEDQRENATHFGGTIILHADTSRGGIVDHYTVVDGQQRLTTIHLLIACIAEHRSGEKDPQYEWTSKRIQTVLLQNQVQPTQKIYLQDGDREVYESIMSGAKDMGSRRGKLKAAWGILRKAVRESDPHALMKGLSRFKVIKFACQQDNDPQQIFESLNTRGVKLNEHEKVKNWLLMSLPHEMQTHVYQTHWLRIEECFGRQKRGKAIDQFLRDFVRWKTGTGESASNTYPNLRRWWHKDGGKKKRYYCNYCG